MAYSVEVSDAKLPLADLETTIQQLEQQRLTLVSVVAGTVSGQPANIVTLAFARPSGSVSLVRVSGTLDEEGQTDRLDALAGDKGSVVCFGDVFVRGKRTNVAAVRNP
jgi:hypothetical protein